VRVSSNKGIPKMLCNFQFSVKVNAEVKASQYSCWLATRALKEASI
jgi:hypothetical protein